MLKPYERIDEKRRVLVFTMWVEDDDDGGSFEEEVEVQLTWKVCGLCAGRGKHVNPSIDANGLTAEDFEDDPGFRRSYFRGDYDVLCHRCGGRRVEPDSPDPRWKARLREWHDMRVERAAELRYGY